MFLKTGPGEGGHPCALAIRGARRISEFNNSETLLKTGPADIGHRLALAIAGVRPEHGTVELSDWESLP